MEIERKFLVRSLPEDLETYPHTEMRQGYLAVNPVVRVREDGDSWYLTYKQGRDALVREEYNLPLTRAAFLHLLEKCDGRIIEKTRYRIPLPPYTIELDLFHGTYEGMIVAEVEFPTKEEALLFTPPEWFGEDVTRDPRYRNSAMALS